MRTMRVLETAGILLVLATLVGCKPAVSETASPAVSPSPMETRELSSPTSPPATDSPVPSAKPTTTAPPFLALELGDEEVRNEMGGYALRPPDGWQVASLGGELFVFENEDDLDVPSIPIIWVKGGSLETLADGDMAGAQDAQEMIQVLAERGRRQGQNFEFGELPAVSVAGERSASVNFSYSQDGRLAAGRYVAIHLNERGILIAGIGIVDAWEPFIPTFEAVLASMSFFEPVPLPTIDVGAIIASTPTP